MPVSIKVISITFFFLFSSFIFLFAQIDFSQYKIGLVGGNFVYQGDLTPQRLGSFKTMKPQFGLQIYRIINDAFSLRLNATKGSLYGNDASYAAPAWRRLRNFKFNSPVSEFSVQGVWNFMQNNYSRFSPYLFAGAGLSFVNIKRDLTNVNPTFLSDNASVQDGMVLDAAKKLPRVLPVLPVGIGVSYFINENFSAIAEVNYRLMHSDYLDGVSQAADPKHGDHYLTNSVGLVYSFSKAKSKSLKCPKKVM